MTELVSRLLNSPVVSSLLPESSASNASSCIYTLKADKAVTEIISVYLRNAAHLPPIFTIHRCKENRKVVIYRGQGPIYNRQVMREKTMFTPYYAIGAAEYYTCSDQTEIEYNGRRFTMKGSELVGDEQTLGFAASPFLRWHHPEKIIGDVLEFQNQEGNALAAFKAGLKGKQLEFLVPHDENILGLVLLTSMVIYTSSHHYDNILGDVAEGVIGA